MNSNQFTDQEIAAVVNYLKIRSPNYASEEIAVLVLNEFRQQMHQTVQDTALLDPANLDRLELAVDDVIDLLEQ